MNCLRTSVNYCMPSQIWEKYVWFEAICCDNSAVDAVFYYENVDFDMLHSFSINIFYIMKLCKWPMKLKELVL